MYPALALSSDHTLSPCHTPLSPDTDSVVVLPSPVSSPTLIFAPLLDYASPDSSLVSTGSTHLETTPRDTLLFSHTHSTTSSSAPPTPPCSPWLNTILEEDFVPTANYREHCLEQAGENGGGDDGGGDDGGGDDGGGDDGGCDGGVDVGSGKVIKEVIKRLFVRQRQRKVLLKPGSEAPFDFPFGHQRPRRSSLCTELNKVPDKSNSANTLISTSLHTLISGNEDALFTATGCGHRTSSLPTLHYSTPSPSRPQSSLVTHAYCSSSLSSSDPAITAKLANEATPTHDNGSGDLILNKSWPRGGFVSSDL